MEYQNSATVARTISLTPADYRRVHPVGAALQVSRNYLAALQHLATDLDQMGVEVIAVSGDPRERAEAFVRFIRPCSAQHKSADQACLHRSLPVSRGDSCRQRAAGHPVVAAELACCTATLRRNTLRKAVVSLWLVTTLILQRVRATHGSWLGFVLPIALETLFASGADVLVCPTAQVETLKATTGGKPITYKIAYGLPIEVMLEWGLYISKPRYECSPAPRDLLQCLLDEQGTC